MVCQGLPGVLTRKHGAHTDLGPLHSALPHHIPITARRGPKQGDAADIHTGAQVDAGKDNKVGCLDGGRNVA